LAQPFDAKRLELTGDALPIDNPVLEDTSIVRGVFAASENGSLTYVEGSSAARQLSRESLSSTSFSSLLACRKTIGFADQQVTEIAEHTLSCGVHPTPRPKRSLSHR
jgi:hypothetical protein